MQIYSIAKRIIAPLNLPYRLIEESVKAIHVKIVQLTGASGHKIIVEWNGVRHTELSWRIIITLQHLSYHYLSEGVLVHTRWSFMHKDIVIDLCKAQYAILKWNGRVKTEKSQVKVSSCDVFRLNSI